MDISTLLNFSLKADVKPHFYLTAVIVVLSIKPALFCIQIVKAYGNTLNIDGFQMGQVVFYTLTFLPPPFFRTNPYEDEGTRAWC